MAYKETERKEKLAQKKYLNRKTDSIKSDMLMKPVEHNPPPKEIKEISNEKAEGQLDSLLENLKKRPALKSFDSSQRSKQPYDATKRYPRALGNQAKGRTPTPPIPSPYSSFTSPIQLTAVDNQERKSSANKFADSAWKLLEKIDFNTDLSFDFD